MKHLPIGGSTITRTLACPGWVKAAENTPKLDRSMSAANRGSVMHDILEIAVNKDCYTGDVVKTGFYSKEYDYTVTAEDIEEMDTALEAADEVLSRYGIRTFHTEQFFQAYDDTGGSADLIGWSNEWVMVLDWKTGFQAVDAYKQGAFYAWCAMLGKHPDLMNGKKLVVVTIQPKVSDKAITHEFSESELLKLFTRFDEAIKKARLDNAPRQTGEHCQYCPVAPYCKEKRTQANRFLQLSAEQSQDLAEAMNMLDDIKAHIKAVEAEVFNALKAGERVPGYKLVEKQARRSFSDENELTHFLLNEKVDKEVFTETKVLSPAQLEKSLKKAKIKLDLTPFVVRRSSGETIAPEDDKRPAIEVQRGIPDALKNIMG